MSKSNKSKIKAQYDDFLKNGELLEMFPHFSGIWEEDKDDFEFMFEMNQDII